MANMDRQKQPLQESPEDLARRLQSLLEEPWSPDPSGQQTKQPNPAPVQKPDSRPVQQKAPEPADRPKPDGPQKRRASSAKKKNHPALVVLHDLVVILAAVALLFTFVVRISRVDGDSMYPTLVDNDRILLLNPFFSPNPRRGDVVVAKVPSFSKDPIVKRVIAVEGDTVDINFETGEVTVNGSVLQEPYINELTRREFGNQGTKFPLTVEKDHVFLLGDNRNESYDSRYAAIGQVDRRCILGRACVLLLPGWDYYLGSLNLSRVGLIDQE